jgi:4'-phosphopantetheinyl transferase
VLREAATSHVIEPGTVQVWSADLDRAAVDLGALSRAERARAARLIRPLQRSRWIRARAVLRHLLGDYLERDPAGIELIAGRNGKPAVIAEEIEFNLSHSDGAALFAFTAGSRVGVDLEHAGPVRDPLGVAARALGDDEYERLRALPEAMLETEFLRSWVRHEAALKCGGDRLGSRPSDEHFLVDLEVGPGAAAALASELAVERIDRLRFEARAALTG